MADQKKEPHRVIPGNMGGRAKRPFTEPDPASPAGQALAEHRRREGQRKAKGIPRIGRPPKLSRALADTVADIIRAGNWIEEACRSVGISRDTHYDWIKRANGPDTTKLHRYYSDAILRAIPQGETALAAALAKAAQKGNVAAATFLLQRRFPDRWGPPKEPELPPGTGSPATPPGGAGAAPVVEEKAGPAMVIYRPAKVLLVPPAQESLDVHARTAHPADTAPGKDDPSAPDNKETTR
jgi:hypothetical protein